MSLSYASPAVMHSTLDLLDRPGPAGWTTIVGDDGPVVALRDAVVAPGSILDRRSLDGSVLVNARDLRRTGVVDPGQSGLARRRRGRAPRAPVADRPRATAQPRTWPCSPGSATASGWEADVGSPPRRPAARRRGPRSGPQGRHRRLRRPARPRRPDRARRVRPGRRSGVPDRRWARRTTGRCTATGVSWAVAASWSNSVSWLADAGLEVVAVDLATAVMSERGVHRLSVHAAWWRLTSRDGRGTPTR